MITFALTGGIGSGKSTVANILSDHHGVVRVSADQIARDIVEPGKPTLQKLAKEFGAGILNEDGSLNRQALADEVFVDEQKTKLLNSITHPVIRDEARRQIAQAEKAGARAVVYDIPLLVETHQEKDFDYVIVVDVDREERARRLIEYRGLTKEDAYRRINNQCSDEERLKAADIVIDNNGPLERLPKQVERMVVPLLQMR